VTDPIDHAALRALAGTACASVEEAATLLDESGVVPEDVSQALRPVWGLVAETLRRRQPLDTVVLREGLKRYGAGAVALGLELVGNSELGGLTAERLALVREASLRRQYLAALRSVARVVTDQTQPLANAVTEAAKLLSSWQDETDGLRPLDSGLVPLLDRLDRVQRGEIEPVLETGIEALDAVIGGLPPTLVLVGALPGVGKSALIAGIIRNLAGRGVVTGLVSLEDEREWLIRRLLALEASVPVFVLANRRLGNHQLERINERGADVHKLLSKVLCDDRSGLTVAEVVASARAMVARGAKAIFVDHLGEIRLARSERHDLDIDAALGELRAIAKAHGVPVVVLTHLRRREGLGTDSEPRLTDFAFSAACERKARVALGLWRSSTPGELKVTVLKQTQGQPDLTVTLRIATQSGVVVATEASEAAKRLYDTQEATP
jgi:replicative DNA helicase